MNITPWTIYWITRLDGLGFICGAILTACVFASTLGYIVVDAYSRFGDELKNMKKVWRVSVPVGALVLLISTFIPTTKEAVAMIVVPKILENEKVQKLPDNFLNLANEWMEELRPGKKK